MSKMITSSSGDYSTMLPQSVYSDVEMKMMEEETASTVDSSTLIAHHLSSANFASSPMIHNNSVVRAPSKGKGGKKIRTDEDDEEIDLDKCIAEDHNRISVKILRKVIPKLRIACYYSDEQVSGKKKLKHLWDEKPADWPESVPFKDPNNAIKDAKKPGKDELAPMYEYLRERYMEKKSNGEIPGSFGGAQPLQAVASAGVGGGFQDGMFVTMVPNMGHLSQQAEDEGHNVNYHTSVTTSDDTKFWNTQLVSSWATVQPSIHEQPRSSMIFMDENRSAAVLAPTAPTRAEHPSLVMNRQILPNLTAIPEQAPTNWHGQVGIEPASRSSRSPPAPVRDLYHRLKDKQSQVETISGHNGGVQILLAAVQKEVIDCLYDKLLPDDTKLCLMFLDMGHQYEALLDVMLVLDKMEESEQKLLHSGCQEIIQKFNKECSTLMALFGVTQSRDPDAGMINSSVKSAVYGVPETFLQELVNGEKLSSVCIADDDKEKAVDFVPADASTLGIRQRSTVDHGQLLQLDLTQFFQMRFNPGSTTVDESDDKKTYSSMDELCRDFFANEQQQQPQVTVASPNIQLVETDQTATTAINCSSSQSSASLYGGQQSGLASGHESVASFATGGVLVGADVSFVSGGIGNADYEAMDLDVILDDIDDVITQQESSGELNLSSGGVAAANQTTNGSSLPYGAAAATSSYERFSSLPAYWPNNAAADNAARRVPTEPIRQQFSSGLLGQTGLRTMPAGVGVRTPIPLSVANATVDEMDDNDRTSSSRRRQSRGSVSSRNGRHFNGRT